MDKHRSEAVDRELPELGKAMRDLWRLITADLQRPAGKSRLQKQQFWVLTALAHGSRSMSDLAGRAQITQTSLTGIVDRLEERGFVQRDRSGADRRVVEVAITKRGRTALGSTGRAFRARLAKVMGRLEAGERAELLRLIRKLTAGGGEE